MSLPVHKPTSTSTSTSKFQLTNLAPVALPKLFPIASESTVIASIMHSMHNKYIDTDIYVHM